MFKSIKYLRFENGKRFYLLEDTDFICEVSSAFIAASALSSRAELVALIKAYKKRKLPVARNVALFYLFYKNRGVNINNSLEYDKKMIEHHYPELEFEKKYLPCVKTQLKQLLYKSH